MRKILVFMQFFCKTVKFFIFRIIRERPTGKIFPVGRVFYAQVLAQSLKFFAEFIDDFLF